MSPLDGTPTRDRLLEIARGADYLSGCLVRHQAESQHHQDEHDDDGVDPTHIGQLSLQDIWAWEIQNYPSLLDICMMEMLRRRGTAVQALQQLRRPELVEPRPSRLLIESVRATLRLHKRKVRIPGVDPREICRVRYSTENSRFSAGSDISLE